MNENSIYIYTIYKRGEVYKTTLKYSLKKKAPREWKIHLAFDERERESERILRGLQDSVDAEKLTTQICYVCVCVCSTLCVKIVNKSN